jgi:hypothetical protein
MYPDAQVPASRKWPASFGGFVRWIATLLDRLFGALSTALLLAVVVTLPVLQFFALGYMLNAAGRLARTGRVSDAFPGVAEASRIGQTLLAGWPSSSHPRRARRSDWCAPVRCCCWSPA